MERAVVEGMRRGDRAAMGRFFDLYFDRIYGLAYRLTGDRTLAEDVTQEVCYRIQRGAHALDVARDPAPWVLQTTVNTCRSIWRSPASRLDRASRPLTDDAGRTLGTADLAPAPDEALVTRERERMVQEALLELELPLREIVILHDYQGLDHKEIARALGVSHSAARKRYSRALAGLARRLKGMIE